MKFKTILSGVPEAPQIPLLKSATSPASHYRAPFFPNKKFLTLFSLPP